MFVRGAETRPYNLRVYSRDLVLRLKNGVKHSVINARDTLFHRQRIYTAILEITKISSQSDVPPVSIDF